MRASRCRCLGSYLIIRQRRRRWRRAINQIKRNQIKGDLASAHELKYLPESRQGYIHICILQKEKEKKSWLWLGGARVCGVKLWQSIFKPFDWLTLKYSRAAILIASKTGAVQLFFFFLVPIPCSSQAKQYGYAGNRRKILNKKSAISGDIAYFFI